MFPPIEGIWRTTLCAAWGRDTGTDIPLMQLVQLHRGPVVAGVEEEAHDRGSSVTLKGGGSFR